MSDEFQDLDEMLGFLGERGRHRRDPEEHPSPEQLSAYQAGELTPEEDKRIQDHLAVCRHCTELLLDLEEFLRPPAAAAAEPAADFEAAADWKRLREGMGREAATLNVPRREASERSGRSLGSLRMYQTLAAVLGLLVVGLSLYTVRPHGSPEILPPPQGSMDFTVTRGAGPAEPLKVRLPCTLNFLTTPDYPRYRVEILAGGGHLRYSLGTTLSEGLIHLKGGSILPGAYEVQLSGLKDGRYEPVGRPRKLIVQP